MSQRPLKIIQITDPHLFREPDGTLRDVVTRDSFCRVLEHVQGEHFPADAVVVTGDLAQDEIEPTYVALAELLTPLGCPVLCLPGNHDDPRWLERHLNTAPLSTASPYRRGSWDFHLLSTQVAGKVHGTLTRDTLDALREALAAPAGGANSVIFLHHPPFAVGSRWLDSSRLSNADELLALCRASARVRAVFCGHVHQAFETVDQGVILGSTPSTGAQFLPGSERFALDTKPPGYRVINLFDDGRVDSKVVWLDA